LGFSDLVVSSELKRLRCILEFVIKLVFKTIEGVDKVLILKLESNLLTFQRKTI